MTATASHDKWAAAQMLSLIWAELYAANLSARESLALWNRIGPSGEAARCAAFVGAEFGPDWKVIGNFQGLIQCEVEFTHDIEHASVAGVFDCRGAVENHVVVGFRAARIGGDTGDDPTDVGDLLEQAEFLFVGVQIAHQNDVVFAATVVADGTVHLSQCVDFGFGFVGFGVDIDQSEGECLIGGRTADAERGDHGRTLKQIVAVVDGVDGAAIDFDGLGIEDEGVLFFAVGTS